MKKGRYLLSKSFLYRLLYTIKHSETRRAFRKYFPNSLGTRRKAWRAWLVYGMKAVDFYNLSCEEKKPKELRKMVSYFECFHYYSAVNPRSVGKLLGDKFLSFQRFHEYYKRDIVLVNESDIVSGRMKEIVKDFIEHANSQVVVKPLNANMGKGIGVYNNPEDICRLLASCGGGVLEELIKQQEEMASFNRSSVNTLRINTVNYGDGEIEVLWPCFRMGRAGSFVDNAGAGGIFGAVDVESGAIIGVADEKQHRYSVHPDSQKQLVGYIIPHFKEACELARKVAAEIPEAVFVGWDLALTDEGWVLVEGNHTPLIIWQIASGAGIRDKFQEIENRTFLSKIQN